MPDMKAQPVTEGECVHRFCYGFQRAHPKQLIECDPCVIGVNIETSEHHFLSYLQQMDFTQAKLLSASMSAVEKTLAVVGS